MKEKINFTILRPAGNNTALVSGINRSPQQKQLINNLIMKKFSSVEQVGFVDLSNKSKPILEMAGGEFCGNAARSTAFLALKGRFGSVNLQLNPLTKKLKAGVDNQGTAWTQIPIPSNPFIKKLGYTIVNLQGISFVVTKKKASKQKAKNILKKLNLLYSVPAAGVMFIKIKQSSIKLNPIVWVQDIKTFFNETACASGTAAVGMVLAKSSGINKLSLIQPSGEIINTVTTVKNKKIIRCFITGPIKILRKNLTLSIYD